MTEEPPLYCYVHPKRETRLRCNQCERPICSQCAILTPTGYRCKECIRNQQKVFDTSRPIDYISAPLLAAVIALIGSLFPQYLGFFTIFLAPLAGMVVVEGARWISGRRRSKNLIYLITGATLIGCLPFLISHLQGFLNWLQASGSLSLVRVLPLMWQAIYSAVVTSSVYFRLTGIRFG